MKKYEVIITINGETWGSYTIIARDSVSAIFLAGMKFQREESSYSGDYIVCHVLADPTGEQF